MKPFHAVSLAFCPVFWTVSASAQPIPVVPQPQTVLLGVNPVPTGKDVAPAGTTYVVPSASIADAVIAVAQQGSQDVGILFGPYNSLATGMNGVSVDNAVIRNTGSVCVGCRPRGGIGLAQFGSNLILAYPTQDSHIHLRTWTPSTWPMANPPDLDVFSTINGEAQTTYAPNLVSFNGSLVLAFRDDNNVIHVWSSAKGDFSDLVMLNDDVAVSDWAPAVASNSATLMLGRQVGDPGCLLNCKNPDLAASIGPSFSPEVDFNNASMDNSGPGALGFGSDVFFSWRGQGNRNISFTSMTVSQLSADLGSTTGTPNAVTVLSNGEASEHTPNLASIGDITTGQTAILLWHDGNNSGTGSDGSDLLFESIASAPPGLVNVCTSWKANYIDTFLGEDVLANTNQQVVPAAFANYTMLQGTNAVMTGTLGVDGCLTAPDQKTLTGLALNLNDGTPLAPITQWTMQLDGTFTKKKLHSGDGPITITVSSAVQEPNVILGITPPPPTETILTAPFSITGPGQISSIPSTFDGIHLSFDPVTGVSAFISTVLVRDETDDLGFVPSSLTVFAQLSCAGPDLDENGNRLPCMSDADCPTLGDHCDLRGGSPGQCASDQSCASATLPELFIAPPLTGNNTCPIDVVNGDDHWKFIIAHEFGHVVQVAFNPLARPPALYNPQVAGRPPICRCDHVTVANAKHCMQDTQRWNDAQVEGFAHFYSANIWNSKSPTDTTCTFEYYKEFLVTNQPTDVPAGGFTNIQAPPENLSPPLAAACDGLDSGLTPGDGGPNTFFSILPPLKVDCFGNPGSTDPRSFVNYREQAPCWPANTATDLSTEFDWLKFYTNVNRNPTTPSAQVGISALLSLYTNLCNTQVSGIACGAGTTDAPLPAQPTWDQVLAQASTQFSVTQATAFKTFGATFGVDRNVP
jgi:hypothetical protein